MSLSKATQLVSDGPGIRTRAVSQRQVASGHWAVLSDGTPLGLGRPLCFCWNEEKLLNLECGEAGPARVCLPPAASVNTGHCCVPFLQLRGKQGHADDGPGLPA